MAPVSREQAASRLRVQADSCRQLGSPLYAELLTRASSDAAAGGPVWHLVEDVATEYVGSAWPLRLMAAVHRLALEGKAPGIARHYPSVGGEAGDPAAAWPDFRAVLEEQRDAVAELLARPCQTNEVGRAAALICGLLWTVDRYGLPLRLLELGASAGLNLRMDRFAYSGGGAVWGPSASPCKLDTWVVPPPLTELSIEVVERRGCDPHPVDPSSPEGRLTLQASVWPDQPERYRRLQGALLVARVIRATVDTAGADDWAPERLAEDHQGVATVLYHSVVWRYVPEPQREALLAALAAAGARATAEAPLVWLRLEPARPERTYEGIPYPLRATTWPGGEEHVLATALAHGQDLRWIA